MAAPQGFLRTLWGGGTPARGLGGEPREPEVRLVSRDEAIEEFERAGVHEGPFGIAEYGVLTSPRRTE